MKWIKLAIDETLHRKMWKDKEKKGFVSWEKYIEHLFGFVRKLK